MSGLLPVSALLSTDAESSSGRGRERQSNDQGVDHEERPSYILPPLDRITHHKVDPRPLKASESHTSEARRLTIGDDSDSYDATNRTNHHHYRAPHRQHQLLINDNASAYRAPEVRGHGTAVETERRRARMGADFAHGPSRLVVDTEVDGYITPAPHRFDRLDISPRGDSGSVSASSGVEGGGRSASSSAGSVPSRRSSGGSATAVPEHNGNRRKRPRRAYEEIDRMYLCQWPGCNKSYGTLNHLNAHVALQGHGAKRTAAEFRDERRAWRARRKAEQMAKDHLSLQSNNSVGSDEESGRRDSSGSEKFKSTEQDMDTASRALLTMAGPRARPPDALPPPRPPLPEWGSNSIPDPYWRGRPGGGGQDTHSKVPMKERGVPHQEGPHKFVPPQEALAQLSGQYNGTYPKGQAIAPAPAPNHHHHHHVSWRPDSSSRQSHPHTHNHHQQQQQRYDHHRHKGEWGPS